MDQLLRQAIPYLVDKNNRKLITEIKGNFLSKLFRKQEFVYTIKAVCTKQLPDSVIVTYYDYIFYKYNVFTVSNPCNHNIEEGDLIDVYVKETDVLTIIGLAPVQNVIKLMVTNTEAEEQAKRDELHKKIEARRDEWSKWDYLDFIKEFGEADVEAKLLQNRRPVIHIKEIEMADDDIPVGASKMGGYPDLPETIAYPTTGVVVQDFQDEHKEYPASSMQLMAQFNLEEVAPYDDEHLLPGHGMLYFFWSGELAPWTDQKVFQVIYYDGDTANLARRKPELPYFEKYFDSPFETCRFQFQEPRYEYDVWNCDLEEELGYTLCEYHERFEESGSKLFGYPKGVNISHNRKELNLFQSNYHQGLIHSLYWYIDKEQLERKNFSLVLFNHDID